MTDTPPQPRAAPDDLPHVPDWVIERGVNPAHYRAAKRIEGRIFGPYQWQDQNDRAASMVVSIIEALTEATEPLQARVRELRAEVERLRHANRTRPDYNLTCQECGRAHILDTSLPSEIWNQIAAPEDLLCTTCIDDRLAAKGLKAEAEFYYVGKALLSRLYDQDVIDAAVKRHEAIERGWTAENGSAAERIAWRDADIAEAALARAVARLLASRQREEDSRGA